MPTCGCTSVEYPKQDIPPGGELVLKASILPEHKGPFEEKLIITGNINDFIELTIRGIAL
ncbi:MAG: DUF1573 domain-containing protein [Tannerellaceae bacterium]|nr:DUF1573 domain-containing protein [Tannerellaceae bacterium]